MLQRDTRKNKEDWAISSEAPNRRTFNDYLVVRVGRKRLAAEVVGIREDEDIVCSYMKI